MTTYWYIFRSWGRREWTMFGIEGEPLIDSELSQVEHRGPFESQAIALTCQDGDEYFNFRQESGQLSGN